MPDQIVLETHEERQSIRTHSTETLVSGLPLIAIAGASGKTSTGWMLIGLLERDGLEVASWLSDGVYVDYTLRNDELHAWELATLATRAREIDILVQEIPSVLASNLPRNSTRVAVLTSICGSDEQCQREAATGRDRQAVEDICATVRPTGRIVANADDLMIVEAAANCNRPITYYAMNGGNPILRDHVDAGGDAVWVQNGWVKAQIAGSRVRVVQTSDLPGTLDGHLIFQVQNALASIAAYAAIRGDQTDLALIGPSRQKQPFASHRSGVSIDVEHERTVVADQPGSLLAVRHLVRGVRSFGPKRVIHVLGEMEALCDDDVSEAARIVGSLGGIALLLIDGEETERTDRIKEGLMNSVNPPVIIIRDRSQTPLAYIRSLLEAGDVALVLGHDL